VCALPRNMCPSEGTMDIFVEPVLLAAATAGVRIRVPWRSQSRISGRARLRAHCLCAAAEQASFQKPTGASRDTRVPSEDRPRVLVVRRRGAAMNRFAGRLSIECDYVRSVGSRRSRGAEGEARRGRWSAAERLATLKAPAGLDLGAITPDEIAVSIPRRNRRGAPWPSSAAALPANRCARTTVIIARDTCAAIKSRRTHRTSS